MIVNENMTVKEFVDKYDGKTVVVGDVSGTVSAKSYFSEPTVDGRIIQGFNFTNTEAEQGFDLWAKIFNNTDTKLNLVFEIKE